MHTHTTKEGAVFNFNSDLSGEVHIRGREDKDGGGIWVSGGDLLEFIFLWLKKYALGHLRVD